MSSLIGALRVSLSADTAQFQSGLARAKGQAATAAGSIQKSLGGIKAAFAGLAAGLTVGMLAGAIKSALDYAGSLQETAEQVGVTAKALQEYRFIAGQVGVSQEELEKGMAKLNLSLSKARAGAEAPKKAFDELSKVLGKDILQSAATAEQAIPLMADAFAKLKDKTQIAALGATAMGKAFQRLMPIFNLGSKGINELILAANELGIVLSDEQIQSADRTADKLEAMNTALKAQLAGVVADNAQSILDLANAFESLVVTLARVVGWLGRTGREFAQFAANAPYWATALEALIPGGQGLAVLSSLAGGAASGSSSVTVKLGPARVPIKPATAKTGQFLAGSGGKKKGGGKEDHTAEDRLRDEYQFAQQMRRANMDILRAQQDLAADYVERTTIGIEILNAEKDDYEKELEYQVALGKLTKGKQGLNEAQADQLRAAYGIKDGLEREKLLQDEQTQRAEDVQKLTEGDFDRRRDALEAQSAIATTAAERRAIELELLRIAYEQKRQALQNIIDTSKDQAEIENARRDLANLNQTYGADQQGVRNATRGPLEEWAASVPQTAAQINEALQSIETEGLQGLEDAIMGVIDGTKGLKEAFGDLARSIVADILRMTIKMLLFRAISGIGGVFGGGAGGGSSFGDFGAGNLVTGMASGGSIAVLGRGGTDRNLLSMNGVPIARVSRGERINVGRDGVNGGTARVMIVPTPYFDAHVQGQATLVAAPLAQQAAVMGAAGAGKRSATMARRQIP